MYKEFLGGVELDCFGETANQKVARLQVVLGGVFNAVWHGYTALHPVRAKGCPKGNPHLNPEATCKGFLDTWKRCGFDAYEMDRQLSMNIDWGEVRAKWMGRHGKGRSASSHHGSWSSWGD